MHIGKHIWQLLREKQISVKEFAEATNTERTTMYRILHRKSIDISVLVHYSRVLNHNLFQDLADEYKKKAKDIDLTEIHRPLTTGSIKSQAFNSKQYSKI
ncbi:MAG: helix-turn-helix transcriptional regulator [Bacteroidales bacterium]|nr:helix-turn-helix transcriptional regulator [Bacteroidales bacterium]